MSAGRSSDPRTPEERAEQLMERFAADASKRLTRLWGRAREEVEDIVAEARSMNQRQQPGRAGSRSQSRSNSGSASKR